MSDKRIETVARALCKLDGLDPDVKSAVPGSISIGTGILNHDEPTPRWHDYIAEARRFVAAHDALSALR